MPDNNAVDKVSLDWIRLLGQELERRSGNQTDEFGRSRLGYKLFDDYYTGRQGLRFVATGYRELFSEKFQYYRENVCQVVVDTVEQRLDVDGFRFPSASSSDTSATDDRAWQVWQDNGLDARSQIAHNEALIKGLVYVLVSPFNSERVGPDGRSPRITIEQPDQAIVACKAGSTERLVGLKRWRDTVAERWFATLYYPDRIEKFQQQGQSWANQWGTGWKATDGWARRLVPGETWPLANNLGVVPLVPLVNRPRLGEGMFAAIEGSSDIEQIVPIQDAINFLALNGLIASDKAAFPQKWATGVEFPIDPKTGKRTTAPDIDDIISTRAPDARFGNFDVAALSQYDDTIKGKLGEVALIAQIPIANFIPQTGQPASGEARESAEIGLTKKAERKQRHFGEGWEEVLRLSFRQLGDDDRASDTACEAVWKFAGQEPASAKVDALTKEREVAHIPLEVIWERLGYSATQRAKFRKQLEAEREWLNSTPVKTTQPDATPAPDAVAAVDPTAALPAAPAQPVASTNGAGP